MVSHLQSEVEKTDKTINPKLYRSNLWRLTLAQAFSGANAVVVFATGAIVGDTLASSPVLATLPISIFVVGMAACVFPVGEIARCYGRRTAFVAGSFAGVLAGLLSMAAVFVGSFWLFCLATFFGGACAAVVMSFRFAATDGLPTEKCPQALSFVMVGGIVSGVVGPQLVTHTMSLWPSQRFAATFLAQVFVALLTGGFCLALSHPRQLKSKRLSLVLCVRLLYSRGLFVL